MSVTFPDGGTSYIDGKSGPEVSVRFGDGVLVRFRSGSDWPRTAWVSARSAEVRGLRLDLDASFDVDGEWRSFSAWKTGVNGIDGAEDMPAKTREAALALCRRRAREARDTLGVVAGTRRRGAKS